MRTAIHCATDPTQCDVEKILSRGNTLEHQFMEFFFFNIYNIVSFTKAANIRHAGYFLWVRQVLSDDRVRNNAAARDYLLNQFGITAIIYSAMSSLINTDENGTHATALRCGTDRPPEVVHRLHLALFNTLVTSFSLYPYELHSSSPLFSSPSAFFFPFLSLFFLFFLDRLGISHTSLYPCIISCN